MIFWRQGRSAFVRNIARAAVILCFAPLSGHAQGADNGVPVNVAQVTRKDVPELLRGLGTVQALYSVQIRSQVDGALLRVPVAEGQDVKKGDVLAIIDPRSYQANLDAALARKAQDEANLIAARADLVRYSSLAARQVSSQQQLEQTQAKVSGITAAIAADEAAIATAKLNLAWCYITAPFDGRVGLRLMDPGNFIRAAEVSAVLPLAQIQPISVIFTLPQDSLPAVQAALAVGKPPVIALRGDDKTEIDQGSLQTIENSVDSTTGTIKLKAIFPNARNQLWPGQFVNTRLLIGTSTGVITAPSSAVRHGQNNLFVYMVKPDNTVTIQKVEVARDDGTTAVISGGLQEGQTIVTEGQSRLQNGARISIINAPAKQAATPAGQGG